MIEPFNMPEWWAVLGMGALFVATILWAMYKDRKEKEGGQ